MINKTYIFTLFIISTLIGCAAKPPRESLDYAISKNDWRTAYYTVSSIMSTGNEENIAYAIELAKMHPQIAQIGMDVIKSRSKQVFCNGGSNESITEDLMHRLNEFNLIAQNDQYEELEKFSNEIRQRNPGEAWELCRDMEFQHEDVGIINKYLSTYTSNEREILQKAFSRFNVKYDGVENVLRLHSPLLQVGQNGLDSYIGVKSIIDIDNRAISPYIKVLYIGDGWLFANSIKIVADEFTWEGGDLKFSREVIRGSTVWEYSLLRLDNELRSVIEKLIKSKKAIIRIYGKQYYNDIKVSNRMKRDLSSFLAIVDIIESAQK